MLKKTVLIICIIAVFAIFTGCSPLDLTRVIEEKSVNVAGNIADNVMSKAGDINLFEKANELDDTFYSDIERSGNTSKEGQERYYGYYDSKTGKAITTAQHYWYGWCDGLKRCYPFFVYGGIIIGILFRLPWDRHALLRKIGLVALVPIPIIYNIILYASAIYADTL